MINDFPQALTIAGSENGGGAGMQADLHTLFAEHVYGTSVLTACVAGNSYGVHVIHKLPIDFINQEFKDIADDFKIKASKTGMLADANLINAVYKNYTKYDLGPLVVDPVIASNHGEMLLENSAIKTLKRKLIPIADVLTLNFYESQKLSGIQIKSDQDMKQVAEVLQELGANNIMIKGKNDNANRKVVKDYVLLKSHHDFWLSGQYYPTHHKDGTGDTLSAAITANLAKGMDVKASIIEAKSYVDDAIKHVINVGHKLGPINHYVKFQK
ncbi:hydroxymethylpyrimidine/phosphomethylpyrimidine kinase [Philodulcilactobacillus myokoensis]|uniref:Hydroxymethylpyrimidine/phosphomethylpyrimidine kinase n=1 Tax=Philodulcilactobacillus myokoensis TaxID=2929573 RepID=A0A9W6ESI0_9LACO|nr:bifunctional hydroxymethylpyrimidine kinase/phosphomethylpyrimidine kinase [Philodulcilactobacillus myokoensis]GLB46507.1 hydroxymethylpyrimidine/phosphomethylpyrimidine kinase [Philodulcilactobacillus myokoensis]